MKTITITDDEATVEALRRAERLLLKLMEYVEFEPDDDIEIYETHEDVSKARATLEADRERAVDQGALVEALGELTTAAERAVKLSKEHADFKLYAMEPMDQAIAKASAALAAMKGER